MVLFERVSYLSKKSISLKVFTVWLNFCAFLRVYCAFAKRIMAYPDVYICIFVRPVGSAQQSLKLTPRKSMPLMPVSEKKSYRHLYAH